MEKLPYEIRERFFSFVPIKDIVALRRVSRMWKAMAECELSKVTGIRSHPLLKCRDGCRSDTRLCVQAADPRVLLSLLSLCVNVTSLHCICVMGRWKEQDLILVQESLEKWLAFALVMTQKLSRIQCLLMPDLDFTESVFCPRLRHLSCGFISRMGFRRIVRELDCVTSVTCGSACFYQWKYMPNRIAKLKVLDVCVDMSGVLVSEACHSLQHLHGCVAEDVLLLLRGDGSAPSLPRLKTLTVLMSWRSIQLLNRLKAALRMKQMISGAPHVNRFAAQCYSEKWYRSSEGPKELALLHRIRVPLPSLLFHLQDIKFGYHLSQQEIQTLVHQNPDVRHARILTLVTREVLQIISGWRSLRELSLVERHFHPKTYHETVRVTDFIRFIDSFPALERLDFHATVHDSKDEEERLRRHITGSRATITLFRNSFND